MNNFQRQTGYSGKSLVEKLGYKPGDSIFVIGAPTEFLDYLKSEAISLVGSLSATWAHGFFTSSSQIANFLQFIEDRKIEKGFWVSWPKKSSGVETDLTEQTFHDLILPNGWVDTKVAAIDETWSGLKFLRRKKIS